jgi:hypothetical protein
MFRWNLLLLSSALNNSAFKVEAVCSTELLVPPPARPQQYHNMYEKKVDGKISVRRVIQDM